MITIIATLTLVAGYGAGRLHGRAARKRFLAEGFRILHRKAIFTGRAAADVDDHLWTAREISEAFNHDRAVS